MDECPKTIENWMAAFGAIYGAVDARREPEDLWVAANAHFSQMGEAIRRMNFHDLFCSASHGFCWMCSFLLACQRDSGLFGVDDGFSRVVAAKYPHVCGHCRSNHCSCRPSEMDAVPDKSARYEELLAKKKRLDSIWAEQTVGHWCEAFDEIFEQSTHVLTLEAIGFHFLEEVGEEMLAVSQLVGLRDVVSADVEGIDDDFVQQLRDVDALTKLYIEAYPTYFSNGSLDHSSRDPGHLRARVINAKMALVVEFGDTFSWFCSVLNKVRLIARNCNSVDGHCDYCGNEHFEKRLAQEYLPGIVGGDLTPRCPSCQGSPCECVFYMDPPADAA